MRRSMATPTVPETEIKGFECRMFGTHTLPRSAAADFADATGGVFTPLVQDVWPIVKSLIAVSNKYGITFMPNAEKGGLDWCYTDALLSPILDHVKKDETHISIELAAVPKLLHHVPVPGQFWNVALNSDESFVVVCSQRDVMFYQIQTLIAGNGKAEPFQVITIGPPQLMMDFMWSNVTPSLFAILLLDGSVQTHRIVDGVVTNGPRYADGGCKAMAYNRTSDLLAVGLTDLSIVMLQPNDFEVSVCIPPQKLIPGTVNSMAALLIPHTPTQHVLRCFCSRFSLLMCTVL